MTTNDPTSTWIINFTDLLKEAATALTRLSREFGATLCAVTKLDMPIEEGPYNFVFLTPNHCGQGTVYNLLSFYYEKERMADSPPSQDTIIRKTKPLFIRKTTRSTIHPIKNRSWKGKR